jgi:hypothetical protein
MDSIKGGLIMRRLTLVAALAAVAVAVPLGIGSSHREAPLTALDPTADETDVYAFTAKNDPDTSRNEESRLTVVANWIPFEDPAGGPNFYRFDDRARYYINIDNNGDGDADVRYRFKFETKTKNPESFLYAAPQVTRLDDEQLNVTQTYDVDRLTDGRAHDSGKGNRRARRGHHRKGKHRAERRRGKHRRQARRSDNPREVRIANDFPVAPNNVGPKTMPNYNALADEAIRNIDEFRGGLGKVFVGQRDDPFFVDLGATFDAINLGPEGRNNLPGNRGGGKDDLAGYSVHSIVLQIPEEEITRDGEEVDGPNDDEAVVGVWASTERRKLQVTDSGEDRGGHSSRRRGDDDDDDDNGHRGDGDFTQVSRLGNPLVNEVIIPLGKKDEWNRQSPEDDEEFVRYFERPELARLLNLLFSLGVQEDNRADIVLALLQGVPDLNRQTGDKVDTLKINLGVPPADTPDRFGVLAGDNAGFPNGRRLADDVVDIELRVVAGALIGNEVPLGDGVDENDKPFSDRFPHVAGPTSGLDAELKRSYPLRP